MVLGGPLRGWPLRFPWYFIEASTGNLVTRFLKASARWTSDMPLNRSLIPLSRLNADYTFWNVFHFFCWCCFVSGMIHSEWEWEYISQKEHHICFFPGIRTHLFKNETLFFHILHKLFADTFFPLVFQAILQSYLLRRPYPHEIYPNP